ncbi:MAG: hypothetical protein HeimC3_21190 [Candidatus Heimdallarchaeota archaeon LC_3]|nr:MAG: hypothetical protein HeimC3_21190 [Candidatus Heimdallarchaeota archaeon LC_3]
MVYTLTTFLGIQDLTSDAKKLVKKYTLIVFFHNFIFMFSNTFIILFIFDLVGFIDAGILMSILLISQSVFDYPTGVLSDNLGQRWVISLSWFCFSFGFIILVYSTKFIELIPVYIFFGIAFALFSGAFETYIDNNYKIVGLQNDPEKQIYGFFQGRIQSLVALASVLAFLMGGIVATIYSRTVAFTIQSILGIVIGFIILLVLKDLTDDSVEKIKKKVTLKNYARIFKSGIKFLFSSKKVFYFLISQVIIQATWTVWFVFILFLIYFGYTGSDDLATLLRSIIFLLIIPTNILVANLSKKFVDRNWLHRLKFFHAILFFGGFSLLIYLIPLENNFSLIGFLGTIFIFTIMGLFFQLSFILEQKIVLTLIPSEIRNSVYSLIPTLVAFLGIPLVLGVSYVIETINLIAGLIILGILALFSATVMYLYNRNIDNHSPSKY